MSYIFISYSHKDAEYAHKIAHALEEAKFSVWIDDRIDYGTQWPHVIQENLDNCGVFVVIMTPQAYQSHWVQNELSRAQRKAKPIFPLLLEGNEPWLQVEATQFVDVRNRELPPEAFFAQLNTFVPHMIPEQLEDKYKEYQRNGQQGIDRIVGFFSEYGSLLQSLTNKLSLLEKDYAKYKKSRNTSNLRRTYQNFASLLETYSDELHEKIDPLNAAWEGFNNNFYAAISMSGVKILNYQEFRSQLEAMRLKIPDIVRTVQSNKKSFSRFEQKWTDHPDIVSVPLRTMRETLAEIAEIFSRGESYLRELVRQLDKRHGLADDAQITQSKNVPTSISSPIPKKVTELPAPKEYRAPIYQQPSRVAKSRKPLRLSEPFIGFLIGTGFGLGIFLNMGVDATAVIISVCFSGIPGFAIGGVMQKLGTTQPAKSGFRVGIGVGIFFAIVTSATIKGGDTVTLFAVRVYAYIVFFAVAGWSIGRIGSGIRGLLARIGA